MQAGFDVLTSILGASTLDGLRAMASSLGAFLLLAAGFSFIIFVHELGHFLVAKWVDIKVTQFAIGFGPAMASWRRGIGFRLKSTESEYNKRLNDGADPATMGETEYRLNWLPLGGYVKMVGQDDVDPASADAADPRSFLRKPIWARMCVISAGVIMNLIFGLLFFVAAFMAGVNFPPAIVGLVGPNTPASRVYAEGHSGDADYLGLSPGDQVISVSGTPVGDFAELSVEIALSGENEPVELVVRRDGHVDPLVFRPVPAVHAESGLLYLGIDQPISTKIAQRNVPAWLQEKGLVAGSEIVAVGDEPVSRYDQLVREVGEIAPAEVPLTVQLPKSDETRTLVLEPIPVLPVEGRHRALLGLIPPTQFDLIVPGTPAAKAGLQEGDIVEQMGGVRWPTIEQVQMEVQAAAGARRPIAMTVRRDGERLEFSEIIPGSDGRLGVSLTLATRTTIVAQSIEGSAAATALNLPPGSRLTAVAGQSVSDWGDIVAAAAAFAREHPQGGQLPVAFDLAMADSPAGDGTIAVTASQATALAEPDWQLPIPGHLYELMMTTIGATGPLDAAIMGVKKTQYFMKQTYITLGRLIQGSVPFNQMRGPIGIAQIGTSTAKQGWPYLMFFLGLISVNLAVFNFLPFPIVDGGLAVMLLIEKIKGSPVSPRVQTGLTLVGLAMLGSLFLYISFHDIIRLF